MTCKICGRGACTESFHSIEEQEEFETKTGRYAPEGTLLPSAGSSSRTANVADSEIADKG